MENVYVNTLVRFTRDIWLENGIDIPIGDIRTMPYKPFGISGDIACMLLLNNRHDIVVNGCVFRPLLRYPGYAVSQNGIVYSCAAKAYLRPDINERYGYAVVKLMDYLRFYGRSTHVTVHKLVAIAWVNNDDYVAKNVVDHIDEDKLNDNASNLQWVSNATNQAKSVYRTMGDNIVVRNIRTGNISIVPGTNAAFRLIGRSQGDATMCKIAPGKIYKGKNGIYEMRYDRDNTPWAYGPDNIPSERKIRSKPKTERWDDKYDVFDTKRRKVIVCNTGKEVCKIVPGVSRSAVYRYLSRVYQDPKNNKYLLANRYLLRIHGVKTPWPKKRILVENTPRPVVIDGIRYKSIREASRALALDQKTIKKRAGLVSAKA